MIDRLIVWWYSRRMRAQQRHIASQPPQPLPFPLQLRVPITTVRAEIARNLGRESGYEATLTHASGRVYQRRHYDLLVPGTASVGVSYLYDSDDELVWSIIVSGAAPGFTGTLGAIDLGTSIEKVKEMFGPADRERQYALVVRMGLWLRPDEGYEVEWYSEEYDDILGFHREGELSRVEWFSREHAPPGYDAAFGFLTNSPSSA